MSFQRFLLISAAAACCSLPIWAQATSTPVNFTSNYVFPPFGLGSTETASITVVNRAVVPASSSATSTAAPSCAGTISFSNANGAIGTPASFTLGSEQLKTVTLPFTAAGLTGIRGEIQTTVALTESSAMRVSCSLVISLETYDSVTGATHLLLSNPLAGVGPILPVAAFPH